MDCPKCSALQPDGAEECASCGIVFERWRLSQERAFMARATPPPESPSGSDPAALSPALVIAGLVVVVLLGTVWTVRNRTARAQRPTGDAMINDINRKVVARQRELAATAASRPAPRSVSAPDPKSWMAPVSSSLPWPEGLDDESAKALLQRCHAFTISQDAVVPKSYREEAWREASQRYKWLEWGLGRGYFQLERKEDGLIIVHVTRKAGEQLALLERADEYELRVGRRRVTAFSDLKKQQDEVLATFTWAYEGKGLEPPRGHGDYVGRVTFRPLGSSWMVYKATLGSWQQTDACGGIS